MIDNWDFNQSDGRPNIMEGSGYGGGSFRDDWARWSWKERICIPLVTTAIAVAIGAGFYFAVMSR